MKKLKKVFICSPYRGEKVVQNYYVAAAQNFCLTAVENGYLPLAPHLIFPQFLDDSIQEQREMGIKMGLQLLEECDEVWVEAMEPSEGMREEIKRALSLGKKIVWIVQKEETDMEGNSYLTVKLMDCSIA